MNIAGIQQLFGRNHNSGENILHELVRTGSLELLYRIRDNYGGPLDFLLQEFDNCGKNCIHVAADTHRGRRAILIIQVLMELGADLNAGDYWLNMTVLHLAVYNKDYALAKWLCQQPILDINAMGFDGTTAFGIAYSTGDYQMMIMLRPNCSTYGV
uniref:Vankyrin 1 n=1 Tax=Campoletis chlorideae ichnovirus TaxID=219164 RepID=Q0MUT7_9VIRU|nr:vankyrin 1 [Campoletis chlorideae ichnovirus]